MPLWGCDIDGCLQPGVRTLGDCIICGRHLCALHITADMHTCPQWKDAEAYDPAAQEAEKIEIDILLKCVNFDKLAKCASMLRSGIPCKIPLIEYTRSTRSSIMGGMNYHLELHFEDGITWLARIRRFNASSPPPAVRDYILRSEFATYKFLEQTAVPAPRVYDFALEGVNNEVGVGYFLMEKLPGKSLRWATMPPAERAEVMRQLASIYIELQRFPFDAMGSFGVADPPIVKGFARESLMDIKGGILQTLGPFTSEAEYHIASIQFILDLILSGELYTNRSVDAYLIHRFVLDLVPQVTLDNATKKSFFLKHADDKGDHILVNESGKITGIIDWEWAYTAPSSMAFNSPLLLLPVADFYEGSNAIGEEEVEFAKIFKQRGYDDLAAIIQNGRVHHRFTFCCGYDLEDWSGFTGLFRGLRDAVNIDAGLDWEQWRNVALDRYKNDNGLCKLLAKAGSEQGLDL